MINRRTTLLALGITPLLGRSLSAGEQTCSAITEGNAVYSESVHTGAVSADGRHGVNARLCRYPALGQAWVWGHAYTPDGFWAFTDHCVPCGTQASDIDAGEVAYSAEDSALLSFQRRGQPHSVERVTMTAKMLARSGHDALHGAGTLSLQMKADFSAERVYKGLLQGRTEVFGRSNVELLIDGVRVDFAGPAQFHEQIQSTPRFTQPFTYATLWGRTKAITAILGEKGSGGYLIDGDTSHDFSQFAIAPPGDSRRFVLEGKDGRRIEAMAVRRQHYAIPVYNHVWQGSMVSLTIDGEKMMGNINDFMGERLSYDRV